MSFGGLSFPKGYRFYPSEEELLSYYLQKKNQRVDPLITAIIPEIDVSKHEPHDLPALVLGKGEFLDREWFTMADSPDWYFFSPRVFKNSNNKGKSKSKSKSSKIERTTKEGSWKKQGNDRRIKGSCSNKQHIGGKRILTFYLAEKKKTDWVIHEYYLTKPDSDEQIGDFVLCRLKYNGFSKKSGKSDHDRQEEDQGSNELENVDVIHSGNDDEAEYGSKTGPGYNDHDLRVCNGQPDRYNSCESEIIEKLLPEPGALASLDKSPTTLLQSPICTKLDTDNFLNDENRKRKCSFADSDLSVTKKNHTDEEGSTPSSDSENQPANVISGGYHPGGNLGSDLPSSQESLSINREPRDLSHDNNSIEWDHFPSIIDYDFSLDFSDPVTDGHSNNENNESAYALIVYELVCLKDQRTCAKHQPHSILINGGASGDSYCKSESQAKVGEDAKALYFCSPFQKKLQVRNEEQFGGGSNLEDFFHFPGSICFQSVEHTDKKHSSGLRGHYGKHN